LRANKSYHRWTDSEVLVIRALKNNCKMTARRIAMHTGKSTIQINHALYKYVLKRAGKEERISIFSRLKRFIFG